MYDFKLDVMWIIIFILVSCVSLIFILCLLCSILDFLENKFNIICVCVGWRFNNNFIIPLFCACRDRTNYYSSVKIVPKIIPKLITEEEYINETGNLIIENPNKDKVIGILYKV